MFISRPECIRTSISTRNLLVNISVGTFGLSYGLLMYVHMYEHMYLCMLLCLLCVETYIRTNTSPLYTHINIFINVSTNNLTYLYS